MPAAHINSLLLTAPVLNTLKLSNFCCAEISAMKGRQLSLMMQGHFKIPVSFSAALLRFYTDVRHQSISLNLAVSLNYGDGDKLFCQLSTSVTVFFLKANMTSLLSQLQSIKYFAEQWTVFDSWCSVLKGNMKCAMLECLWHLLICTSPVFLPLSNFIWNDSAIGLQSQIQKPGSLRILALLDFRKVWCIYYVLQKSPEKPGYTA